MKENLINRGFYSQLLDSIHPFYDGNGRTCKILFVSSFLSFKLDNFRLYLSSQSYKN